MIVGKFALEQLLIAFDKGADLRLGLFSTLEILRNVCDIVFDCVLVLQRRPDGATNEKETIAETGFGRLPHDIVEDGIRITREENVRLARRELREYRAEVLRAGLEQFDLQFNSGILQERAIDIDGGLAEGVVLEKHRHLPGIELLQIVHHQLAETR